MASKAMWEVNPETRSQLQAIQKENNNGLCCDCGAPSPQWASPKFGIFICLSCAGIHRGLGVHISFVRSISMDAFKPAEIERMRLGGNANWRAFFEAHPDTQMRGLTWDDATIAERYSGDAGDEWKERLTAKVEGREYVPSAKPKQSSSSTTTMKTSASSAAATSGMRNQSSASSIALGGSRTASPATAAGSDPRTSIGGAGAGGLGGGGSAGGAGSTGKIKVDEKYFARLGAENASRPDHLPPSQGGKYAGFGNTPGPSSSSSSGASGLPNYDELQADPIAALTKGFGWFTTTVTKTAQTVNSDYIQPTAKQIATSDLAAQARVVGGNVARSAQVGARNAQESFNRFVEGPNGVAGGSGGAYRRAPIDESKRDFWDDFSSIAEQRTRKPAASAIGTSAMVKGNSSSGTAKPPPKKDEWDDW